MEKSFGGDHSAARSRLRARHRRRPARKETATRKSDARIYKKEAAKAGEASDAAKRFEDMARHYKELMGKYAPGLGAGVFLESAVGRRAAELAAVDVNVNAAGARRGRRG